MVPSEPVASHHRLPTAEPMTGHRPTEPGPTSNWGSNMLVSPGPSATAMSGRLQSPVAPNSGARLRLEAGHHAGGQETGRRRRGEANTANQSSAAPERPTS